MPDDTQPADRDERQPWYIERFEDRDVDETEEWLEAFEDLIRSRGKERARFLLRKLFEKGHEKGVERPFSANRPYINTIPRSQQPPYPGDRDLERRIKSIVRWNAMAMVVRANRRYDGIGGHISTFASAATLYQVGMHHFFRGRGQSGFAGDLVYYQGHASPGIYSYAFLEGRISLAQMENFRRELADGGGLSSYPHPWLMPEFWEFPTVSMGLGPISAIYQARFNRYLQDRGLLDTSGRHIWAFLGDGETDEPEALGALSLAARERLDNLIFVVNCNLQRLDGPVRGNGKIIQELETNFRGAGWNVIKVIWGDDWDPLIEADNTGLLVELMNSTIDGEYQKLTVESGDYIREHYFGRHPELLRLVENLSDKQLSRLRRGGHDPEKVHAAYRFAVEHKGSPTVILAKTIKGYGLGEAGEGRNVTHSQKKLNEEELREFRDRFDIPISDSDLQDAPFYRPAENSPEIEYLRGCRARLGGSVPQRRVLLQGSELPKKDIYEEFHQGFDRQVSTTMVFVRLLTKLLKDPEIGKRIVPIVPDEARTFGMESLFRSYGIYSHAGQQYEPVDAGMLLYYKEATNGQILEEGITEAGSMSSFIAAATAYSNHGIDMIPFFVFYSMFGFQRIGDLAWACGDQRGRGFMLGATSGRTTLNGEGLQHQDGHSLLLASTLPNLIAYDPAYAFELAVIVRDGLRRMYEDREDVFYYITLENENYVMPAIPEGAEEGILRGIYLCSPGQSGEAGKAAKQSPRVQLLGSGSILREALRAQTLLADQYGVHADVWSATSYQCLRRDALAVERWNLLHPELEPRHSVVEETLGKSEGPVIAVSDYIKTVPDQIARWLPDRLYSLGTDGFGRSESRENLRRFFEIDAESIVLAALTRLVADGQMSRSKLQEARDELGIDPEKADPAVS